MSTWSTWAGALAAGGIVTVAIALSLLAIWRGSAVHTGAVPPPPRIRPEPGTCRECGHEMRPGYAHYRNAGGLR